HMTIAAFVSTSFAVAGVHALLLLKNPARDIHRKAMRIALTMGAVAALIQPISGDRIAKTVAKLQPAKFAALESLFETRPSAPLTIGGIPNEKERKVDYAIEIPGMLSFLAHGDIDAAVTGLDQFPEEEWPPVLITHAAFQIMVAIGMFLA